MQVCFNVKPPLKETLCLLLSFFFFLHYTHHFKFQHNKKESAMKHEVEELSTTKPCSIVVWKTTCVVCSIKRLEIWTVFLIKTF